MVFVDGIIIGKSNVSQAFAYGDFLDIPVQCFPNVLLPAKLRFVLNDFEIASPFAVTSNEEVMLILGLGDISVKNLSLDNSLLRGTIISGTNGLHAPNAYIKINGQIVRSVIIEPPRALDEGGSASRFAVQIRPGDFNESGLLIDLYLGGMDYPAASLTYARSSLNADARRLIEMEETVRQIQKSTFLQIEMLRDSLDQQLIRQQERIDTFIEYAMSLIVDKLAGESEGSDGMAFLEALLQLKSAAAPVPVHLQPSLSPASSKLSLNGSGFVFGWYDVELNEHGSFRWMSQTSLVRNPYPARPVRRIQLTISQVYGSNEPMLKAALDQQEFVASTEKRGNSFVVTLSPSAEQPVKGESLYLESFVTGCPAANEGTTDNRILSVSVADVTFFFETGTGLYA